MKDRKLSSARVANDSSKIDPKAAYEEHCLQELRLAGYRITMPRIQVIRALADATTALSAYAIHERIVESGGRIDVVSVYRILATLQQVGLIHHVGLVDGYFPCRIGDCPNNRSLVLVADDTNFVYELPLSQTAVVEIETAARHAGFVAETIRIELKGMKSGSRK
ncbi:MAG TPA: transcriptional repressor [Fimbriimonadaceae bacterium]|nr:transcriptional repressor [Fimbriimonadaceae bacterium]